MTSQLMRGHQATLGIDEALQLDLPDESVDALAPGQHIHHGQYHIHGVLGRGSFATVYDAEHLGLARRVAIKVPLRNCDKKALLHERFVREARLSALVQHPNVLAIYDAGSLPDGTPFLVLERVEGDSLNERFVHGVLPIAEVIEIGRQLAMALTSLVAADIVHRDIKPANVMLHRLGGGVYQVKLVDLGVAKRRTPIQAPMRLTMQGELIGTPQYMSSEQLRGEEVDARTDIYGAAAVLYEALTGKPPHESTCFSDYMVAALSQPVLPVRSLRPDCPPGLERVLLTALECEPAKRQASPRQLLAELEACELELRLQQQAAAQQVSDAERMRAESALAAQAVPTPVPPAPSQTRRLPSRAAERVRGWATTAKRTVSSVPRVVVAVGALMLLLGGSLVGQSTPAADHVSARAHLPAALPVHELPRAIEERAPHAQAPAENVAAQGRPEVLAEPAPFAPPVVGLSLETEQPAAALPTQRREEASPAQHRAAVVATEVAPSGAAAAQPAPAQRVPVGEAREPAPPRSAELARVAREPVRRQDKVEPGAPRPPRTSKARELAVANTVVQPPEPAAVDKRAATPPPPVAPAAAVSKTSTRATAPTPVPQAGVDAQQAMASALKAFATGRLSEAKASYQQVLRANPSNAAALRGLGLVSATLGQPDAARQALRRYLQLTPNAPDAAQIAARIQSLGRP